MAGVESTNLWRCNPQPANACINRHLCTTFELIYRFVALTASYKRQWVRCNRRELLFSVNGACKSSCWTMFRRKHRSLPGPFEMSRSLNALPKFVPNFRSASSVPAASMSSIFFMKTISTDPSLSKCRNNWGIAEDWKSPGVLKTESDWNYHFALELTSP